MNITQRQQQTDNCRGNKQTNKRGFSAASGASIFLVCVLSSLCLSQLVTVGSNGDYSKVHFTTREYNTATEAKLFAEVDPFGVVVGCGGSGEMKNRQRLQYL